MCGLAFAAGPTHALMVPPQPDGIAGIFYTTHDKEIIPIKARMVRSLAF